jgi:hypothetical protein
MRNIILSLLFIIPALHVAAEEVELPSSVTRAFEDFNRSIIEAREELRETELEELEQLQRRVERELERAERGGDAALVSALNDILAQAQIEIHGGIENTSEDVETDLLGAPAIVDVNARQAAELLRHAGELTQEQWNDLPGGVVRAEGITVTDVFLEAGVTYIFAPDPAGAWRHKPDPLVASDSQVMFSWNNTNENETVIVNVGDAWNLAVGQRLTESLEYTPDRTGSLMIGCQKHDIRLGYMAFKIFRVVGR